MRKSVYFVFVVFLMITASCSLQKYTIKIPGESVVEMPPEVRKLLVINRSIPSNDVYKRWVDLKPQTVLPSRIAADTLKNLVNSIPLYLSGRDKDYPYLMKSRRSFAYPMNWQDALNIANRRRVDGIISLENFDANYQAELVEKDQEFMVNQKVDYFITWRIYNTIYKTIINEALYNDSLQFSRSFQTKNDALTYLQDTLSIYNSLAIEISRDYYKKLVPEWFDVKRKIYIKGSEKLEKAHEYVEKEEWGRAAGVWEPMVYKEDSLLASRASHNMAVYNETKGRLNLALAFARKANNYKPSAFALRYINTLNRKALKNDDTFKQ